jgi:hypothetical protein
MSLPLNLLQTEQQSAGFPRWSDHHAFRRIRAVFSGTSRGGAQRLSRSVNEDQGLH